MIHEIAPHRFDNTYQPNKTINKKDFILHFKDNTMLLKQDGNDFEIPRKEDISGIASQTEFTFLFTLDDCSCFLMMDEQKEHGLDLVYQEINFFRTIKQHEIAWISLVGFHLWYWYTEHKYCGKCGAKTIHKSDERALVCTACHSVFYPKISPAVIVAIISNDKILLARNTNFKGGWYSLLAGYTDIGESLEETVIREVKEEVGLDVTNIRYYKSSPWPLSGAMMVGYIAEADENQSLILEENEIADAKWFTRDNLPEHPRNISISGEMIEKFKEGKL